jgi:hypothetical protein
LPTKPLLNFSIDTAMSSCLYASRNDKIPGSGKIYHSFGCFDSTGELGLDEDFTFACVECGLDGGTNCYIKSSVTKECATAPNGALDYPAGEDARAQDQVVTAACGAALHQKWDVTTVA